jgi:hypothetical protein
MVNKSGIQNLVVNDLQNILELENIIEQEVNRHGFGDHGILAARLRNIGHPVDVLEHNQLQKDLFILQRKLIRHYLKAAIRRSRFAKTNMGKHILYQ